MWSIDPHTKAKHQILQNYLQAWFPILGSWTGRLIYLDGFAGPGLYEEGEEGSPIIAIKTALEHPLLHKFKAELIYHFVESNPERAAMLEDVLKDQFPSLPDKMRYFIHGSEFAPTLNGVLNGLEERGKNLSPTFAFLDPFGFSGLPMELIARMLNYASCEVLITFMAGFVNRFNDEMRENVVNELFGTEEWKKIRTIETPRDRQKFLIDLYKEQLQKIGGATFVRSFQMKNQHNQIIYHLVFGTKHIRGLEVMKEAMLKVDTRGSYSFEDTTNSNQTFLIDYRTDEHWVPRAAELVFDRFKGLTVGVEQIHNFVISETPYIFRKKILQFLERENKIIHVSNRKRKMSHPDGCIIIFVQ